MCKYCEPGKNHENLLYEDIDLGVFGEGCVLTSICGTVVHGVVMETLVGFGDCDTCVTETVNINYCPMCGRKLGGG